MLKDIAAIGDKIILCGFHNQDATIAETQQYRSQLLDFIESDKACIAMPIVNGRLVPLDIGDKYQFQLFSKAGLYQCDCVIIDRFRSKNIFMLVVQMVSDLSKFQRRQFFRLECVYDITFAPLNEEEMTKKREDLVIDSGRNKSAIMTDISGGGCKFTSRELVEKGHILLIKFRLMLAQGLVSYEVLGKVIYSALIPNNGNTFEHRIEFVDLKKSEREQIVRFIFDEERRRVKKEKGLA